MIAVKIKLTLKNIWVKRLHLDRETRIKTLKRRVADSSQPTENVQGLKCVLVAVSEDELGVLAPVQADVTERDRYHSRLLAE